MKTKQALNESLQSKGENRHKFDYNPSERVTIKPRGNTEEVQKQYKQDMQPISDLQRLRW